VDVRQHLAEVARVEIGPADGAIAEMSVLSNFIELVCSKIRF